MYLVVLACSVATHELFMKNRIFRDGSRRRDRRSRRFDRSRLYPHRVRAREAIVALRAAAESRVSLPLFQTLL